jgi:hypothetical protein
MLVTFAADIFVGRALLTPSPGHGDEPGNSADEQGGNSAGEQE